MITAPAVALRVRTYGARVQLVWSGDRSSRMSCSCQAIGNRVWAARLSWSLCPLHPPPSPQGRVWGTRAEPMTTCCPGSHGWYIARLPSCRPFGCGIAYSGAILAYLASRASRALRDQMELSLVFVNPPSCYMHDVVCCMSKLGRA